MRIRKRPPPPQIPSDPNAPNLEERSTAARSAHLHLHRDLLKGRHGWKRIPDPSPIYSHDQILEEEKKETIEVDSHKKWNSIVCSEKSSVAKGPYEDSGDEKAMLKAKDTTRTFKDDYDNDVVGSTRKKRQNATMEGSRCSRVNGRGWRCCQETMVGYALCEHHLGKGRLRSIRKMRGSKDHPESMKGRRKVRTLKARSISSLISECTSKSEAADQDSDGVRVENGVRCEPDGFNDGATQIVAPLP